MVAGRAPGKATQIFGQSVASLLFGCLGYNEVGCMINDAEELNDQPFYPYYTWEVIYLKMKSGPKNNIMVKKKYKKFPDNMVQK